MTIAFRQNGSEIKVSEPSSAPPAIPLPAIAMAAGQGALASTSQI